MARSGGGGGDGRAGTEGAEDGGRQARGDGGDGRVAAELKGARRRITAGVAEESGRRQEATVAVENFGSLTALCHKMAFGVAV